MSHHSDLRQTFDNVGDYLKAVGKNAFGHHHWVYVLIGAAIAAIALYVVVDRMFRSESRREGRGVRAVGTAITNVGLFLAFFGFLQSYWWLVPEKFHVRPLLLNVESIKSWGDFTSFGYSSLLWVGVAIGVIMFLRLSLKILAWIPALAAIIGLIFVVNFVATLTNV